MLRGGYQNRGDCIRKLTRAFQEFRVRGVTTNKNFLLNVLNHPVFAQPVTTSFIADHPGVLAVSLN